VSSTETTPGTDVLDPSVEIAVDTALSETALAEALPDIDHSDDDTPTDGRADHLLPRATAMYLPPQDLVIAENVRKQFDLDDYPQMRASIRNRGVEKPMLVERQPDGALHVVDGQLRLLFALDEKVAEVPAWVVDADLTLSENERRIRNTLLQLNVNHWRVKMTQSDDAAAIALMLDLGASVTRIADGLQTKRAQVKKAAAVGASATAKSLVDSGAYTLDQLVVISEYEQLGDTDAVQRLADAPRYDFGFRAKKIEQDRRETRSRLQASLLYAALGFGILTAEPGADEGGARFLPVQAVETGTGEPVGEELIRSQANLWVVWVEVQENADLIDQQTGELIDPGTVDPETERDGQAQPAAGLRHANSVTRRDRWTPSYYLLADRLPESGLHVRPVELPDTEADASTPDSVEGASRAERARQDAAAAAAQRELDRLERRRVRELNKHALGAADRRGEFLVRLLRRAKPPAQAAAFVAESLVRYPDLLNSPGAPEKARELLGAPGFGEEQATAAGAASAQRAQVIVLGLVLAAFESMIDKSFWRTPYGRHPRYLKFLAETARQIAERNKDENEDFTLSEVEQAAAGLIDYRDIDLDI